MRFRVWVAKLFMVMVIGMSLLGSTPTVFAAGELPTLKPGMTGEAVVQLQNILQSHGFYQDDLDGKFGNHTRQAVIQVQLQCGLLADGVVGPATWQALRDPSLAASRSLGRLGSRGGEGIVAQACGFIGVPYVWGGYSPSGFDCSGFVYYIYGQNGISLPRMADDQYNIGAAVSQSELQPGDLVYFSTYLPGPSHVGIYIGDGQFVHASSAAGAVTVTPLAKPYYQAAYLGARRVTR